MAVAVATAATLLAAIGCAGDGRTAGPEAREDATSSRMPAPAGPDGGGDIRLLAERIVELHPDPFHHVDRTAFQAGVVEDPADRDELLVAAMRVANLGAGEGHGGVYPWAQPDLEAWPLHLFDFDDGMRLVAGGDLVAGARLVAIGGTPLADVVDAVRPLVPHDTEATIRSRLPAFLVFPSVLRGLGFDTGELTWELPDGTMESKPAPATVPAAALAELLGLFQPQVPPSLPYDRDRSFWSERRGAALYVRWNQAQARDAGTSMAELATALVDAVEEGGVERVVVDARHNPGGEIGSATPLVLAAREIEQLRPGTLRFLVGRGTFSAASYVIAGLVDELDVLVVGEPTGGSSRSYGDPRRVDLPASGIVAFVNTREYVSGVGRWASVEPDIAVPVTWADWSTGDAALDAALDLDLELTGP